MSKTISKLALAAGLLLAVAFMASCTNAFVGKWVRDDGSESLELFDDGTGIATARYVSKSISWKVVNNKRFVITSTVQGSSIPEAWDCEISGRILTLTNDEGKSEIWVKAQKGKIEGKVLTDKRDGKKYKTVIIGTQTWMAENLNYGAEGSKCYGEGGEVITYDRGNPTAKKTLPDKEVLNNCAKYGRLYDWTTAKKACPSDWHLPSKNEWDVLEDIVGGMKVASKKLKATSGWNEYQGESSNGTDDYGFSALPGGSGRSDGSFNDDIGYSGLWWSASDLLDNYAVHEITADSFRESMTFLRDRESNLHSVRCLQGLKETEKPIEEIDNNSLMEQECITELEESLSSYYSDLDGCTDCPTDEKIGIQIEAMFNEKNCKSEMCDGNKCEPCIEGECPYYCKYNSKCFSYNYLESDACGNISMKSNVPIKGCPVGSVWKYNFCTDSYPYYSVPENTSCKNITPKKVKDNTTIKEKIFPCWRGGQQVECPQPPTNR